MLLKTYDSDIFNNWVQTDWIDGAGGITEITSIDITANDGKLTMDALTDTITLNNIDANPFATILLFSTTKETAQFIKTKLGQYDLKVLDQIRDVILHKKGNETLIITSSSVGESENGSTELAKFVDELVKSQSNKLGGMLLKTYDSDIFNNWIKTAWIDGTGGITEITALKQIGRAHV